MGEKDLQPWRTENNLKLVWWLLIQHITWFQKQKEEEFQKETLWSNKTFNFLGKRQNWLLWPDTCEGNIGEAECKSFAGLLSNVKMMLTVAFVFKNWGEEEILNAAVVNTNL